MPARSQAQQRLFGMVHAYQKGELKHAPKKIRDIADSISEEDAEHFAKTKHKGLPQRKSAAYRRGFMDKLAEMFSDDNKTFTLSAGQTPSHVVAAWNRANPNSKITVAQLMSANGNLAANKYRAGKAYKMPATAQAPAAPAAPAPAATRPPAAAYPATGPIGYRRNNPGNLKSDGRTRWDGSTGVPAKGEIITFGNPEDGLRAMAMTVKNYGRRHGINTPAGVVNRYAPASENNQAAYLQSLRQRTGYAPRQRIDLTDAATLRNMVTGMAAHEIGPRYSGTYSPSMVSNAVYRALNPSVPRGR